MKKRLHLKTLPAFGQIEVLQAGKNERGLPVEVVVLRDNSGAPRAYTNECQHVAIPLDSGSRDFFDDDTGMLICLTHGALYQLDDGMCVAGPCRGRALQSWFIESEGEGYAIILDDDQSNE